MNYEIDWKDLRKILYDLWSSGKLPEQDYWQVNEYSKRKSFSFHDIQWILLMQKKILGSNSPEQGKGD